MSQSGTNYSFHFHQNLDIIHHEVWDEKWPQATEIHTYTATAHKKTDGYDTLERIASEYHHQVEKPLNGTECVWL